MTIPTLQSELLRVHSALKQTVLGYAPIAIWNQPGGKWSPAQNLKHVELSILPACKLLSDKQKFISKNLGTTEQGSRTYPAIMHTYQQALSSGDIKAPERFVPIEINAIPIDGLLDEFDVRVNQLNSGLNNFTETELDLYQIPHPLLGLLTIREMIYFYIYHAGHHENNILKSMNAMTVNAVL